MYKSIIRPLLFLFSPETVHKLVVSIIKFTFALPFIKSICQKIYSVNDPILERKVFGFNFKNPVGLAAGFDKNADLFNYFDAFGFSFIEIGTVTPLGQPGNQKPRSFRLKNDKALINRMGFNNLGAEIISHRLNKRKTNCIIGGNIGKNTLTPNDSAADDYRTVCETLYPYVDYFVINVSCPNISDLTKLQDADSLERILAAVTNYRNAQEKFKPVLLKISPDLNFKQIDETLKLIKEYKINGIIATNTTVSRTDLVTSESKLKEIGNGGLSGKPLEKRSTEIIRYISNKTSGQLPIIGVGGIFTPKDALEKLDAGASLIQLYTGFIYEGPSIIKKINKELLLR